MDIECCPADDAETLVEMHNRRATQQVQRPNDVSVKDMGDSH